MNMGPREFLAALALVVSLAMFSGTVQGQAGKGEKKMGQARAVGNPDLIQSSGLKPAYPGDARCPEIASLYGSRTRYDGSARASWAFGGLHGGIDISLPEDTPLLAVAAGTVLAKGEGGMLEGIFLWLKHAPEDTGLSYWVFSKYQHLVAPSELEVGARVGAGQVVARSGKTGTVGKYYGMSGYSHLHLTTRKGASGDEAVRDAVLFDPLAIYHEARKDGGPADAVPISYAMPDGKISPAGSRVVWPVACQAK